MKLLKVPYISQWDSNAKFSKDDCVPTCASMLIAYYGGSIDPDKITEKIGQGLVDFNEIKTALNAFNYKIIGTTFRTIDDLKKSIDAGIPFIAIIHYGDLPGRQDTYSGGHAVVVTGYDDKDIYVNDPDFWSPRRNEGENKKYPIASFEKAWNSKADGNNPGNFWYLDAKVPTPVIGLTLDQDITSEIEDKFDLKSKEWYSKYWTLEQFILDSIKTHRDYDSLEEKYKKLDSISKADKKIIEENVKTFIVKDKQIETLQGSNAENTAQLSVMGDQVKEANKQKTIAESAKDVAETKLKTETTAKEKAEDEVKRLKSLLTKNLQGYSKWVRFKSLFGFY